MTLEEKRQVKERKSIKRDKYEQNNCGGYELIYPPNDPALKDKYARFLQGSI
jgi:hypothetical protein